MPTLIIVIILIIIAIGYYLLTRPKTVYLSSSNSDNSNDINSTDISISAKPINYVYNTIYSSGIWADDAPGSVICPGKSNNPQYCIFDSRDAAINYCNSDKDCQGFVHSGDKYQISKKWKSNKSVNGELVLKQIDTAMLMH